MKRHSPDENFDAALDGWRGRSGAIDLSRFEREVWEKITVRDRSMVSRLIRWLNPGVPSVPDTGAAACVALAVLIGVVIALLRADAYEEHAAQVLEQRYVASIHPVYRSESHDGEVTRP